MKTLADIEAETKALTKKQKKVARIEKILGRKVELPKKLTKDEVINCGLSIVTEVLQKGGYRNIKRGWIKKINKTERFHAYPYEDDEFHYQWIYIHRDITENGKHRATKDVIDEKIRLKEFIIPRINRGKKGDKILPREERLKALAELGKQKPLRKAIWKRFLENFLTTNRHI